MSIEARLALRHELLWQLYSKEQRYSDAEASLRAAVEFRGKFAERSPDDVGNCSQLAIDWTWMAMTALQSRVATAAPEMLQEAEEILLAHPNLSESPDLLKALARVHGYWAVVEVERGRVEQALKRHDRGIAVASEALTQEPRDLSLRTVLHGLYRAKAYILCREGRAAEAFPVWDQALAVVDPAGYDFCRTERALELAIVGRHAEAIAEAAQIKSHPEPSDNTLLHLARVSSRAIEAVEREQQPGGSDRSATIAAYATEGVECLRRLPEAFRLELERLKELDTDSALAALRAQSVFAIWRTGEAPAGKPEP
ncbi:MAG: hypothetical protein EXS05_19255 [Planctomycetaceae bacterium]|nr:hypothetical protein [Planctomycetaceae bacterium]